MEDYKGMTQLARVYQKDASFYSDISSELGASSQEMSASMTGINESILAITELVGEVAIFVENMEKSCGKLQCKFKRGHEADGRIVPFERAIKRDGGFV